MVRDTNRVRKAVKKGSVFRLGTTNVNLWRYAGKVSSLVDTLSARVAKTNRIER